MGWDIVAIGTNHNLPIEDPVATAKRLLPLYPGPLSIGYFSDWEYNSKKNLISRKFSGWQELSLLIGQKDGETVKFVIEDACALKIYKELGDRFGKVNFTDEDEKKWFMSDIEE